MQKPFVAVLTHKNTTPPDGFKYLQPETGLWITGDFLSELVERVAAHRQHKGIEPADLAGVERDVVNQLCAAAAPGVCTGEPGEDYQPLQNNIRQLSLAKVATATEVLIDWLKAGLQMVPKEEAKRRAEVCRGCPYNAVPSACVCTPFWKIIDSIVPADRNEPGLNVCGICSCSLRAKVLVPMAIAVESTAGLTMPPNCWIKP